MTISRGPRGFFCLQDVRRGPVNVDVIRPKLMAKEWKLITGDSMTLGVYPCGVRAGDILRLSSELKIRDHDGNFTGIDHPAGEENVVLFGNPDEPDVIWLERPNGERHTWDSTVLETFELTGRRDPRFSEDA